MQSMPLLFRQSLRSSIHVTRTTSTPVRAPFRPTAPTVNSVRPTSRTFSVCLQCQFRRQPFIYSPLDDKDKANNDAERLIQAVRQAPEAVVIPEVDAGAARPNTSAENDGVTRESQPDASEKESSDQGEQTRKEESSNADRARSGGLPSYLESRRSQMSKQFSTMMDNLQSNVFVAGQRLNDFTGYSEIEALKKEIHIQEDRLREARAHVRQAKEDYTTAINRRSNSQREVNELLQRKHAWSPTDLERFTLLYRNDHTNEVSEVETQEALSRAEREAEEAAASLSKCILSRYHEEQVWSDKIRRMSTWGTWGLMGMNVLLFLIFQIAVEPWRRRRLVKGFEDKVVEAMEKEKALHHVAAQGNIPASVLAPILPEVIDSTLETSSTESAGTIIPVAEKSVPSSAVTTDASLTSATDATPAATTMASDASSLYSRLSDISSSPLSLEYWRQVSSELFNLRSITISQHDMTMVAVQSAAAGAVVMGLLIAVVRPR
ncbi:hypothetical protein N7448_003616 [Penicillium atrosanguineum]|uniref:Sensitive to high expression protein 9, mitochondrial n=1 Tax=Penicillium atrosanguineum TaxID=1132637 RepID=A0A9W9H7U8_9EURO|nr:Ubiquinol-cytochrome c reductase iron-sulfur subunit [Penicillium atrosanguineum]KAJ5122482.1 hypothetical protein N7526_009419 [Penicillium atrosanguineum]KAJ5140208.1 hypothetical protein N7448_003616 [Penicillium atrosanguineum]KAJ5310125.1 Ubiquinol-cytochrome c reductase iron-sulfur subunit [Penicillium atrosanguineum]KAJ5315641.1 hypothetical protein N7476_005948 [Penicillium atrosanguineum]